MKNTKNIIIGAVVVFVAIVFAYYGFQSIKGSAISKGLSSKQTEEDWSTQRKKIMEEYDRVWAELSQSMAAELKDLSQDEVRRKLTPLVVDKVTEKLKVSKETVTAAVRESE